MSEAQKLPLYKVTILQEYTGKPVKIHGFSLGGFHFKDTDTLSITTNPEGVRDVIGFKTIVIKDYKGYESEVLKIVDM